jgi:pimeloyl-ACP methyl ester carboxylesterase
MGEYVDLDSGLVHWKDYGGDGHLIILVHGLGGSVANWDAIGPRLSGHGRVVGLDLPGFGLSPPAKDWAMETMAETVLEFIGHFGGKALVVGNSMGALLSEMVASARPDLVDALVLISPATPPRFPDPLIHWPTARRLAINATPGIGPAISRHLMRKMTPRELIDESLRRITDYSNRVSPDMVESFVELAETRRHLPWAADAVPKTGQSIRRLFLKRASFVAMIRDIKAPTLVAHGLADRIVSPTSVEWLCSLRPDWTLVQMDDTGHIPQIDAPIRLLAIVEPWLETLMTVPSPLKAATHQDAEQA